MKTGIFFRRGARREEGMALLFALGFLALMLILGLGFVTTSLLSQKIAANNSGRAQARMFARSAMARAMLNVMLYNDQAVLKGETADSYDLICSYDKVAFNDGGTKHPNVEVVDFSNSSFIEKLRGDTSDPDAVLYDQLRKTGDTASKLKYQPGTEEYYTGENSEAKWMFFYDSPEDTEGRRIIGRAAYQVLPRESAGRLSLYAVTGGSKVKNDYGAYPREFRWGRDVAELNLTPTLTLPNWYDKVDENNLPFKYETMYTSYGSFFDTDRYMKARWLEYWFSEGKGSILKEAFPVLDETGGTSKVKYYHRFNISRFFNSDTTTSAGVDNWYERFKKIGQRTEGWTDEELASYKNSATALEALSRKAREYKESQAEDVEVEPSGLPFLRCIGNNKWSFESLEHLRKQIAANFNDYCDADSIPTGNIKASEWSITDSGKFPDYTGNEKTLYINEVAVQIGKVGVHYNSADRGIGIKEDIDIKTLVELVNMYDNSDTDGSALLDPANLEVKFLLKELSFKIALYGKYTGRITYTYGSEGKTRNVTVNNNNAIEVNKNYGDEKFSAEVKCTDAEIGISGSGGGEGKFSTLQNGYSVGSKTVTAAVTNPSGSDFNAAVMAKAKELAEADAASRGLNIVDGSVKFQVRDVVAGYKIKLEDSSKIQLSPIMLATSKAVTVDGSEVPSGTGVDFVRFDRVEAMTVSGSDDLVEETGMRVSSADAVTNKTYFIGGIEAKDPRQNLNPRSSGSSDWTLSPKFRPGSAVKADENGVPSMKLVKVGKVGYDYEVDTSTACGRVNSDANPAKTQSGSVRPENEADKETATDPAWLGETAGQHVSTAYIRNAPMVSPWEIGLIHRAREWQTLNLKRAGGFGTETEIKFKDIDSDYENWTDGGTEYENGDGAILEFVKVGVGCRCMGKVPLRLLRKEISGNGDEVEGGNKVKGKYNRDLIKMLFNGIRIGQTMKQFYAETKFDAPSLQGGTSVTVDSGDIQDFISEVDRLCALTGDSEFRIRSQFLNSEYGDRNGKYTFELAQMDNDALREELIGKTVNLLTVNEETPPNVFRVIVVAQSINDVGGIGADVSITKLHKGENKPLECQIGRFDFVSDDTNWDNNTYYDEITGETKALVTIERVPAADENGEKNKNYGRMVVTAIEFID